MEDQAENINFISILMNVNGDKDEFSIANDEQFSEICKLMDEYYGLNEKKILNKYEVWREYIKLLKSKKNFEERSRDTEISRDHITSKEPKKEMIQRYTAFLSKLWFSKADPFLKAKFKAFYNNSEHKWGPNMMYKNLSSNIENIKQRKSLVETRLNKEINYNRANIKECHVPINKDYSENS